MKISYEKSLKILEKIEIDNVPTEKLFLINAINRVLAKDIVADHNLPEYLTSSMDGYAFLHKNLKNKLKIIGNNPAGSQNSHIISENTCIKTFTGSLMPKGSDTLIPIENVTVKDNFIIINKDVPKGFATRDVGESYKINDVLIKKGTTIQYAQVGIMAGLNIVQVEVNCLPIIAIASTGNEILDLGERKTSKAQIRGSNTLTLEALARENHAIVYQLGNIKDDKKSITTVLKQALKKSDIVVTTGGVSVGDYDYVKDIIKDQLDATILFQGVDIKPGQHILIAQRKNQFIVGLPGFAYSSTVTFILYVLPLILKFTKSQKKQEIVKATLEEDFKNKAFKTTFNACNLENRNGNYFVNFQGKKMGTSAILINMLNDCALLYQKKDSKPLKTGDIVEVIKI